VELMNEIPVEDRFICQGVLSEIITLIGMKSKDKKND
jgi:hypothetical protein